MVKSDQTVELDQTVESEQTVEYETNTPQAKPVVVAPAMNTVMWEHPATRRHLAALQAARS